MKRILSLILSVCILASLLCVAFFVPASAVTHVKESGADGLDISSYILKSTAYGSDYYESEKRLDEIPHTIEAWVNLNTTLMRATVGTIIGTYGKGANSFGLAINKNFCPELVLNNSSGTVANPTVKITFSEAAVKSATWSQIVVTIDEEKGEASCYINGELRQTVSGLDLSFYSLQTASGYPVRLGGINQPMNPNFFRGKLQDVAIYSDVLSADEIKGNYQNGINAYDENLICYYDIDASDKGKDIEDLTGNGYDLYYSRIFLTEEEMQLVREEKGFADEYKYAIAVIGDIQYMTKSNPEDLTTMYQWIADNMEAKNIKYSIGLGDITDQCQPSEWDFISEVFKIFENAGLEYSVIRGNHDVATVGGIEAASRPTATPERYDEVFGENNEFYYSQFVEHGGFYEEGSVKNTYRKLTIEDDNWLLVNLDFHADASVRAWANEVIAAHPEYRVIITTHEYIAGNGKPSGTYGKTLWNDVASKHANVELVLSGHVTYDKINVYQCKGENGNTVTQMLIDPQYMDREHGGLGVVTMFYLREDGTVFDIEHYSTVKDRYLMNINQITVDLRAECDYPAVAWDGVTSEAPLGTGTAEDPYRISSAANLLWMAEAHLVKNGDAVVAPTGIVNPFEGKYFVQTADIDLYGKVLPSIGYFFESESVASVFGGNYDGCGYLIRNGRIANPFDGGKAVGLFGEAYGASVSGVNLKEIAVEAEEISAFIVGRANGDDTVKNSSVDDSCRMSFKNNTADTMTVGAIIGAAYDSSILDSESLVSIRIEEGSADLGLIAGYINAGTLVYNCSASGEAFVAMGSAAQVAGKAESGASVITSGNKTSSPDFGSAQGAHIHTAASFAVCDENTHEAKCECGVKITLPCVKNEHGCCKYCSVAITGASISLGSEISISYYVSVGDDFAIEGNAYFAMRFTMNGKTYLFSDYYEKNGRLVFTLGGILPHEASDLIDAELLIVNGEAETVIASKLGYSVRENCTALLEKSDDEAVITLVKALLKYATNAQAYIDYNTDRFAAGGVSTPEVDKLAGDDEKAIVVNAGNDSCKVLKVYVTYDTNIKIVAELHIDSFASASITVNGAEYNKNKLKALGDGKYILEIKDIEARELNAKYDISLKYGAEIAAMVDYRVGSHLYSLIKDKEQIADDKAHYRPSTVEVDELEYQLMVSVYHYANSASEYFELQKEAAK